MRAKTITLNRDTVEQLVEEFDNWNASVEKIIGKQPDVEWEALERIRAELEYTRLFVDDHGELDEDEPAKINWLRALRGWWKSRSNK